MSQNYRHYETEWTGHGLRDLWVSAPMRRLRRWGRVVLYRAFRLIGEIFGVLMTLGIAVLFILSVVLARQSTDLTLLRPNLELWFADAFDGQGASFERLNVEWLPATDGFVVAADDILIRDKNGETIERFERFRATLSGRPDRLERPQLETLDITGGVVSYVETAEGDITIGLGAPDKVGRVGPVYHSNADSPLAERPQLDSLEMIRIQNAQAYVRNARSGVDMVLEIDNLSSDFTTQDRYVLGATGRVAQSRGDAAFNLRAIVSETLDNVVASATLEDVRPSETAPTRGRFRALRGLDAPTDLELNIDFDRETGLRSADIDLAVDRGSLSVERDGEVQTYPFEKFRTIAQLDPGAERMNISRFDLQSDRFGFNATGVLSELGKLNDGDINSSPLFDLAAKDITVDLTPQLEAPLLFETIEMMGRADVDARSLSLDRFLAQLDGTEISGEAQLALDTENRLNTLVLNGQTNKALLPRTLMSMWPPELIGGARRWIVRSIQGGQLENVRFTVNLDETFFAAGDINTLFDSPDPLTERLSIAFDVTNGDVRYVETMPLAKGVTAQGSIANNQLSLAFQGGTVGTASIQDGTVSIPRLLPKGGDLIVTARGSGEAAEMLRLVDNPPFGFAKRYNVDPAKLDGRGNVELSITRPLLEFFERSRITYAVSGDFTDVVAPFELGGYPIKDGAIRMEAVPQAFTLSGPVTFGPWRTDMRWKETFGAEAGPTEYAISGVVDADVLDGFGLGSRGVFAGEAAVTVTATGQGMDIATAQVSADLGEAELSLGDIWAKPQGLPASLTGAFQRGPKNELRLYDIAMQADGLSLGGEAWLDQNLRLISLDLPQLNIDGLINGAMKVAPDSSAERLSVKIDTQMLDVSPWTQNAFATRESGLDIPLLLTGQVDRLILDPDYQVDDARVLFSHSGKVVESARLKATAEDGPLSVELITAENGGRNVEVAVPDASKALSAFLGLASTRGGALSLTAELPPAGEDGAFLGRADIRDFRLKQAPVMAKLLSLASLTGLSDTLAGEGMQFDRFTIPFSILGDEIAVRDARLYGPALGMTGDGDINLDLRVMDFDGTLVPSYTANSLLGGIPVLGDLFTSEKKGGLIALTYTVSGPFEQTQIAINPLSALTPGFLRGIFKNERDALPESEREKIEDIAPPPQPRE